MGRLMMKMNSHGSVAERGAAHGAERGERRHEPERAAAAVWEGLGDDALVVGERSRAAKRLDGASNDKHLERSRKRAERRPRGEECHADLEDANLAEHIAEAPEHEERRAGHDAVDACDPLDGRHIHPEFLLHGGKCDVYDGAVENLHECHRENDDQRRPCVATARFGARLGGLRPDTRPGGLRSAIWRALCHAFHSSASKK